MASLNNWYNRVDIGKQFEKILKLQEMNTLVSDNGVHCPPAYCLDTYETKIATKFHFDLIKLQWIYLL